MKDGPIVVVGGHGYLGSRIAEALVRAGHAVVRAGRRARGADDRVIDLRDPSTFEAALSGARAVINASSTHEAPPDALARHCVASGDVLFEASADARVIVRLLDTLRSAEGPGVVVLGVGIFPGLSNQLAAAALDGGADRLALAVRSTPFSGAGAGTVDLMSDVLGQERVELEEGARVIRRGAEASEPMPFAAGAAPSLKLPFAEPALLAASTGVRTAWMGLCPYPALLRWSFQVLPAVILASRPFRFLLGLYLGFVRRLLLASRPTEVDIIARAKRTLRLTCADGMRTGGLAAAAQVELALRTIDREPPRHRAVAIDELAPLAPTLDRMKEIDPSLAPAVETLAS